MTPFVAVGVSARRGADESCARATRIVRAPTGRAASRLMCQSQADVEPLGEYPGYDAADDAARYGEQQDAPRVSPPRCFRQRLLPKVDVYADARRPRLRLTGLPIFFVI